MIDRKLKKWLEDRFISEREFWLMSAKERAELIAEFRRGEQ